MLCTKTLGSTYQNVGSQSAVAAANFRDVQRLPLLSQAVVAHNVLCHSLAIPGLEQLHRCEPCCLQRYQPTAL